MQSSSMRLNGSKNFGYNIELLKWSNRMDLIAFSNNRGEVIVQRLSLQILWLHPPPSESARVRGLDWRPDERILAIAYSTGLVVLIDVENQHEIHKFQLQGDISCLSWTQNTKEFRDDIEDLKENNRLFHNAHEIYLPPLPSFHSLSSNARKIDYISVKSYSTKVFNILMIGLKSSVVHMYVFGVLSCGRIDVRALLNAKAEDDVNICDTKMSSDFRVVFVFVRHNNKLKKLAIENEIFSTYTIPLLNLATKHGHIVNTMSYIDDIIQCIIEAWETALLEMDNKLTKYANTRPDGMVSADFLELLMFGYASDGLNKFLTRDLTEKGLKKLGNSIEISYSTIQQLVIKPLHTGILNICFHLNCIKGMAKNSYYYKPLLGTISNDATLNAGAFLIKSLELQQAIEQSNRDYKIFWGWLYGVIIRLMDESVPDDVAAVTQQDVIYLAEFLNTFDQNDEIEDDNTITKRRFNLERVGQYLQDKNLQNRSRLGITSEWSKLLEQNECLKKSDVIYPHHQEMSLVQEHNHLKVSIDELFLKPETLISEKFKMKYCIDLSQIDADTAVDVHHFNVESKNSSLFIATIGHEFCYFLEFTSKSDFIKLAKFQFVPQSFLDNRFASFNDLRFRHLQFYNNSTISMLLDYAEEQRRTNCFVQFPVQSLQSRQMGIKLNNYVDLTQPMMPINLYELLDPNLLRSLDISDGHRISVSGSRKIATILSESQRRMRHYEMEVEDNDDDEIDMSQSNASLDVSKE